MAEINYDSLTVKQKQTYDFWVKVARKSAEDPELEKLLGLVKKPKTRIRKEINEQKEAITREAEAVLLHLRRIDTLIQKSCQQCHLPFATNYAYVGCCSDECLAARIKEVTGLDWNPEKTPQERWNGPNVNGEIPAIIRPETVAKLKDWARAILSWDGPAPVLNGVKFYPDVVEEPINWTVEVTVDDPIAVNGPIPADLSWMDAI